MITTAMKGGADAEGAIAAVASVLVALWHRGAWIRHPWTTAVLQWWSRLWELDAAAVECGAWAPVDASCPSNITLACLPPPITRLTRVASVAALHAAGAVLPGAGMVRLLHHASVSETVSAVLSAGPAQCGVCMPALCDENLAPVVWMLSAVADLRRHVRMVQGGQVQPHAAWFLDVLRRLSLRDGSTEDYVTTCAACGFLAPRPATTADHTALPHVAAGVAATPPAKRRRSGGSSTPRKGLAAAREAAMEEPPVAAAPSPLTLTAGELATVLIAVPADKLGGAALGKRAIAPDHMVWTRWREGGGEWPALLQSAEAETADLCKGWMPRMWPWVQQMPHRRTAADPESWNYDADPPVHVRLPAAVAALTTLRDALGMKEVKSDVVDGGLAVSTRSGKRGHVGGSGAAVHGTKPGGMVAYAPATVDELRAALDKWLTDQLRSAPPSSPSTASGKKRGRASSPIPAGSPPLRCVRMVWPDAVHAPPLHCARAVGPAAGGGSGSDGDRALSASPVLSYDWGRFGPPSADGDTPQECALSVAVCLFVAAHQMRVIRDGTVGGAGEGAGDGTQSLVVDLANTAAAGVGSKRRRGGGKA